MRENGTETKLNVTRQLRPIRLAFLVRPDRSRALGAVIEANTCLWGGQQNPIIPICARKPKHWDDQWEWPGGIKYAHGLLDAFEPDFIVEAEKGLASQLEQRERTVIGLAEVLDPNRDPHIAYGISAIAALSHAYEEELKFVRRRGLSAIWLDPKGPRPTLFEGAVLGAYPQEPRLQYFKDAYADIFEPESVAGNYARVFDALVSQAITPLRAHQYGLEARPGAGWRSTDLVLFLLDPASNLDVIDFWNLRAWGIRCLPVPIGSVNEIAAAAAELVKRENVQLHGNPDPRMRHQTTLQKARSLGQQNLESCAALLQPRPPSSLLLRAWIPRIWRADARGYDVSERGELLGDHDDVEISLEDRRLRFDLLEPKFETSSGRTGLPCWANTVSLRDYSSSETGLVYPRDGAGLARLFRAFDYGGLRPLRDGISVVSTGFNVTQRWEIPDGLAVIQDWFAGQKMVFRPSAAGKTAVEVARALGGLRGLRIVDSLEVLKCLDKASGGSPILQHELLGLLKREEEHPEAPGNVLRRLVERNVLRLGMLLSCPACEAEGWFALEEIAGALRCGRCLRRFAFPSSSPPNKKWAYRTQGPFALSGYAKGAYATLFALRYLGPTSDAEMTWFPGCEIGPESSKYELDFVAFWRKRWGRQGRVRVLMGECKTFDTFKPKEIRRFREIARRFPETIRVFATLRTALEQREKTAIASLAREGRRPGGSRSHVLVLTATELLATSQAPRCYEGTAFKQFKDYNLAPMVGDDGLFGLCDLTQQVHLGMEPASTTFLREIEKRQARANRAPTPKGVGVGPAGGPSGG